MKFLAGLLTGGAIGIAVFAGFVSLAQGRPTVETRGIAAMAIRKAEIAQAKQTPKILFVGGSSVDLGISAERASQLLGMPAVNMGLIAPLGISYLTEQVKKIAKPEDIVVLALEYNLYNWAGNSELWLDPSFVKFVIAQDPGYLWELLLRYRWNILTRISTPHLATVLLRNRARDKPTIDNMNEYGDRTDNTLEARPEVAPQRVKPLSQLLEGLGKEPKGFPALVEFIKWAKNKNITVIATFPNISQNSEYRDSVLNGIEKQLTEFYQSNGVPIVGSLHGAMFPEEDCYDTLYHLTTPAVERRTRNLCKSLEPHLYKQP